MSWKSGKFRDYERVLVCPVSPKYRVPEGFFLCAQMGEVHTDRGKMYAVPDRPASNLSRIAEGGDL